METEYGFKGIDGRDPEGRVSLVSLRKQQEALEAFDSFVQMRWNSTDSDCAPTLDAWLNQDSVEDVLPYEKVERSALSVSRFLKRRERLLDRLVLRDLLGCNLTSLSNGEMRRAFLAFALLRSPKLLLLDTPQTGLDTASRAIVADLLRDLARRGTTAVAYASAFADELPSNATHLLELDAKGRIVYQGPVRRSDKIGRKTDRSKSVYRREVSNFQVSHDVPVHEKAKILVDLHDVTVRYGDVTIFEHLDWTIREGEKWLLCGPNGSGKTTLLALMQGDHQQAYSNDVKVFGKQRGAGQSIWEIKKRIGWVSPELHATIDGTQTVLDIVLSGFTDTPFAGTSHGRAHLAAAEEVLKASGLSSFASQPFNNLSSGEQRLALLARAVIKNPPLLLLDEPCQNLDEKHVKRFLRVVDKLCAGREMTLIYVTHRRDSIPRCIRHRFLCAAR